MNSENLSNVAEVIIKVNVGFQLLLKHNAISVSKFVNYYVLYFMYNIKNHIFQKENCKHIVFQ